jgi:CubicO group peptidase (beta-lactamase class C family)
MDERQPAGADRAGSHLTALVNASRSPGIQYLVVDATAILFEYDGGWADIGRQAPMDAATTMMAYSMSKTITAAAVLQLVESGTIALDAPAERYLESFPYGPGITVGELVSHTSGLPNPIPLRWVHAATRHKAFDEDAALAAVLRDHPRVSSEPGTKYAYSNIGYWLLGKIVERVSGEAFPSYVSEHVLRPLAIAPREFGYVVADPVHHATGYLEKYSLMNLAKGFLIDRELIGDYDGRWLRIQSHYPNGPAFGGVVGTTRGFGTFLQDQLRPHSVLLSDTTRTLFYAPQQTRQGTPVAMTLGWHIGDIEGTRFFYKEGGGGGFHSMMRVYPASGVATVIMTNATGFDVGTCLNIVDPGFLRAATNHLSGRSRRE